MLFPVLEGVFKKGDFKTIQLFQHPTSGLSTENQKIEILRRFAVWKAFN
jgi:hypothetical protein